MSDELATNEFRFSVRRMLLFMVLVSIWLAGLRVLPEPWLVWLTTAVFYLAIVLMFSPRADRPGRT
jgi:hypothetical protein